MFSTTFASYLGHKLTSVEMTDYIAYPGNHMGLPLQWNDWVYSFFTARRDEEYIQNKVAVLAFMS